MLTCGLASSVAASLSNSLSAISNDDSIISAECGVCARVVPASGGGGRLLRDSLCATPSSAAAVPLAGRGLAKSITASARSIAAAAVAAAADAATAIADVNIPPPIRPAA